MKLSQAIYQGLTNLGESFPIPFEWNFNAPCNHVVKLLCKAILLKDWMDKLLKIEVLENLGATNTRCPKKLAIMFDVI